MPNPHFRVSVISRSKPQSTAVASAAYNSRTRLSSTVASAAYRSGEKLRDERAGKTFDYSRKEDILHSEIIAPDHSPKWVMDRQTLWNEVETMEKRKDSQLARSIIAALPRELNARQNLALVRRFVKEQFVDAGMIVDFSIHDTLASDSGRQPHVHMMLTMRDISPDGFGKKNRDWNHRGLVQQWRDAWERVQNDCLAEADCEERISLKSYQEQGIDRVPGIKMGYEANALERKGVETRKGNYNREVRQRNAVNERVQPVSPAYTSQDEQQWHHYIWEQAIALYEPDYDTLPQERRVTRLRLVQKTTEKRWFGIGATTTRYRYQRETVQLPVQDTSTEQAAEDKKPSPHDDDTALRSILRSVLTRSRYTTTGDAATLFKRLSLYTHNTIEKSSEVMQDIRQRVNWRQQEQTRQHRAAGDQDHHER